MQNIAGAANSLIGAGTAVAGNGGFGFGAAGNSNGTSGFIDNNYTGKYNNYA